MPEVYQHGEAGIGIWILVGFFLQIVMEFFSEGIEHGHVHVHHHHGNAFPLSMMISLCLHSFLEGMPLQASASITTDRSLLFGIILHHLPVAFALTSMLMASAIGKSRTLFFLMLFAFMAPIGAFVAAQMGSNTSSIPAIWADRMMAIVIGIFLHISTTILFESGKDHRFNLYKMVAIVTGGIMGLLAS
jgi:zinc transporter ZupT